MSVLKCFLIILLTVAIAAGCGNNEKKAGPEDVVVEFYKNLTLGEFDKIQDYTIGEDIQEYINAYKDALRESAKTDESITTLASEQLSKSEIEVKDIKREQDSRIVTYTITSVYGQSIERTARLTEVEGEWKIEKICDRI